VSLLRDIRAAARLAGADSAEIDAVLEDARRIAIAGAVYASLLLALVVFIAWRAA